MGWRSLALVLFATGCNQLLGVSDIQLGDGGKMQDGTVGTMCITGQLFKACFVTLPTQPVTVGGAINTDSDSRCITVQQPGGGPDVCMIAGMDVMLPAGAFVQARGMRPLALVAVHDLTVSGLLDVSGASGNGLSGVTRGAGGQTGACIGTGAGGDSPGGPGGGGGGAFGTTSGAGAAGAVSGVAGGSAGVSETPTFVRGGCDGGKGGSTGSSTGMGGPGGAAGGGVYLLAGNSVDVAMGGTVNASGGGGGAGAGGGGAGGGGASGGLIGLDAPTVSVEGTVYATGAGGGGGGAMSIDGTAGSAGGTNSANGGPGAAAGTEMGGNGGVGGIDVNAPLPGTVGTCSGTCGGSGGGGGSVGVIWLNATNAFIMGTVTPPTSP